MSMFICKKCRTVNSNFPRIFLTQTLHFCECCQGSDFLLATITYCWLILSLWFAKPFLFFMLTAAKSNPPDFESHHPAAPLKTAVTYLNDCCAIFIVNLFFLSFVHCKSSVKKKKSCPKYNKDSRRIFTLYKFNTWQKTEGKK